ncbi:MAG: hypothetical protein MUF01_09730 [Bryobacterales bacterium]|jgi:hypothetical protein|nr:hypothetical protein [Bryobacterales bacterium]
MFPTDSGPDEVRQSKRIPALLTTMLMVVLLSPLAENWKATPQDSFPLSYFPMFSHRRADTYVGNALMGVDQEGNRSILSYRLAGDGGFNQVRRQLAANVKAKRADDVCQQVAARVAQSGRGSLSRIASVQVVTQKHHINRFFAHQESQLSEKFHATCAVPRDAQLVPNETTQAKSTSEVIP